MNKKVKDPLDTEELHKKELLLNELKEWANKLRHKANEISSQRIETIAPADIQALGYIYAGLTSNVDFNKYTLPYFSALAREIDPELEKSVNDVSARILDLINISSQIIEIADKPTNNSGKSEVAESESLIARLQSSTTDSNRYVDILFQEIARAKLALLKQ